MILYILKTIICTALFLGIYYLLLEKEKMPLFNRVYLLLSILLSFTIPFITFTTEIPVFPVAGEMVTGQEEVQSPVTIAAIQSIAPPVKLGPVILFSVYSIISAFLLLRFGMNIYRIIRLVRKNSTISYGNAWVVLVKENSMPYSFLCYIFVNEQEYKNGLIENEVLCHEMEHVKQKHSIDIILIELLAAFLWFNPFLILYRKAIQLNHEFEADNAVIRSFRDISTYQFLLLDKIRRSGSLRITSPFNYIAIKKRLIMMTRHTTRKAAAFKGLIVLAVIGTAVFLFSTRVIAQSPVFENEPAIALNNPPSPDNPADTTPKRQAATWRPQTVGGTKEGVSAEKLQEYQSIVDRYKVKDFKRFADIPLDAREKLLKIFKQMSKEQQLQQEVIFLPPLGPIEKKVPSEKEMKAFLDPDIYGVWIDGKKVSNSEISKYKNTDFSSFDVSRLYGRAKVNKRYKYQLNLMTNAYFNNLNEKRKANHDPEIVFITQNHVTQVNNNTNLVYHITGLTEIFLPSR